MFRTTRLQRIGCILAAGIALATLSAEVAPAQGLFESFFGNFRRPAPPPRMNSFTDPFGNPDEEARPRREGGSYASYCVRLCDGRYFPLPRGGGNPAQLCQSLCPAASTRIFSGGGIDNASAHDGSRYADLDSAFVYRDKLVAGCTCNGKDPIGLAKIDVKSDPTLRPGDIVATQNGLMAFRTGRNQNAEFTPVDSATLSRERGRFSQVR